MDDILCRSQQDEVTRPRRLSAAAAELGANVSSQDGEVTKVHSARESQAGLGRASAAGGRIERMNSLTQGNHQRHMPMGPLKFPIPRKTKERRGELFPSGGFCEIITWQTNVVKPISSAKLSVTLTCGNNGECFRGQHPFSDLFSCVRLVTYHLVKVIIFTFVRVMSLNVLTSSSSEEK